MPTDKPRFSVTFTEDSFKKIQEYKEENNISTQSKAVARLVELAISEIESEKSIKNSPSTAEAAPGDPITQELLEIVESSSPEDRALMLEMAKVIKNRNKGTEGK